MNKFRFLCCLRIKLELAFINSIFKNIISQNISVNKKLKTTFWVNLNKKKILASRN